MGADIETGIPANVVEIGNEVTQSIVDALNTAPSPTGTNRFVVVNDINAKADLAGATFTGKINCTSVNGLSGINVGIGGTSANATSAGDLWISTGGVSLNYRDGTGAWRIVGSLSGTNSWTGTNNFNANTTVTTQPPTDGTIKVASCEFVRISVPSVADWNLLTASVTTGSTYNNIVRLVYAGNSTIVFSAGNTLPIGAQWVFINTTTHTRTFSAGAGATLLSQGNKYVLNGQYSICTVIKTASNEYYISGNLV